VKVGLAHVKSLATTVTLLTFFCGITAAAEENPVYELLSKDGQVAKWHPSPQDKISPETVSEDGVKSSDICRPLLGSNEKCKFKLTYKWIKDGKEVVATTAVIKSGTIIYYQTEDGTLSNVVFGTPEYEQAHDSVKLSNDKNIATYISVYDGKERTHLKLSLAGKKIVPGGTVYLFRPGSAPDYGESLYVFEGEQGFGAFRFRYAENATLGGWKSQIEVGTLEYVPAPAMEKTVKKEPASEQTPTTVPVSPSTLPTIIEGAK
jgi:hypothetical protein